MNKAHLLKILSIQKNPMEHYNSKGKRFRRSSRTMIS
jgi:hypothetical protein